jgi:hypothetical protein
MNNRRAYPGPQISLPINKSSEDMFGWPASLAELETMVLIKKLDLAKRVLKEIIYYNPIAYNGHWDRAGGMERMAQALLTELEK